MKQHIVVEVQNQEMAELLLQFLNALDFVASVQHGAVQPDEFAKETTITNSNQFFSYAGIWAGRDITARSIREKAWPRQSA